MKFNQEKRKLSINGDSNNPIPRYGNDYNFNFLINTPNNEN